MKDYVTYWETFEGLTYRQGDTVVFFDFNREDNVLENLERMNRFQRRVFQAHLEEALDAVSRVNKHWKP